MNVEPSAYYKTLIARSKLTVLVLRAISEIIRTLQRFRRGDESDRERRRYLFLQYEKALGSAINTTPIFEALKNADPSCSITIACAGPSYEVLSHSPFIDHVFLTADPHNSFLKALRNIWGLVFRHEFDCVVTGAGNTSGRFSALAALTGVRRRIGFTPFSDLYEMSAKCDPGKSVIQNNLEVLTLLGYEGQESWEPRVFFTEQDLSIAEDLLKKCELIADQSIVAFVTQTSGGHPKNWRDERFAELADRLIASAKCHVIFVGTAAESVGIERIRNLMKFNSISLAGKTNILELAALLSICDLTVALDTGPMHVARAVGLPGVVIAPGWLPTHEWLPLDLDPFTVIIGHDSGTGEHSKGVPPQYIDDIDVSDVAQKARHMLEKYPPSAEARMSRINRNLYSRVCANFV